MKDKIKKEIEKIIRGQNFTLKSIILFGSRAIGNYTYESDWDILIVLQEQINSLERLSLWKMIYKTLHKNFPGHSFDIFVKSEQEYENEKHVVNTIANEATEEGIVL